MVTTIKALKKRKIRQFKMVDGRHTVNSFGHISAVSRRLFAFNVTEQRFACGTDDKVKICISNFIITGLSTKIYSKID